MTDSTPDEGEPTSLAEKAKTLCRKHKGKLIAVCAVALVATAVTFQRAAEQNGFGSEDAEDRDEPEDTGSDTASDEPRKRRAEHEVRDHTRTLRDGRVIPIPRHKRCVTSDDDTENPGGVAA
ncbi:hypothetical protein ACF1B4_27750 [Streptomyces albidoflavus]